MRPQLKGVVWERVGEELRVVYDRRSQLLIADPAEAVEARWRTTACATAS